MAWKFSSFRKGFFKAIRCHSHPFGAATRLTQRNLQHEIAANLKEKKRCAIPLTRNILFKSSCGIPDNRVTSDWHPAPKLHQLSTKRLPFRSAVFTTSLAALQLQGSEFSSLNTMLHCPPPDCILSIPCHGAPNDVRHFLERIPLGSGGCCWDSLDLA